MSARASETLKETAAMQGSNCSALNALSGKVRPLSWFDRKESFGNRGRTSHFAQEGAKSASFACLRDVEDWLKRRPSRSPRSLIRNLPKSVCPSKVKRGGSLPAAPRKDKNHALPPYLKVSKREGVSSATSQFPLGSSVDLEKDFQERWLRGALGALESFANLESDTEDIPQTHGTQQKGGKFRAGSRSDSFLAAALAQEEEAVYGLGESFVSDDNQRMEGVLRPPSNRIAIRGSNESVDTGQQYVPRERPPRTAESEYIESSSWRKAEEEEGRPSEWADAMRQMEMDEAAEINGLETVSALSPPRPADLGSPQSELGWALPSSAVECLEGLDGHGDERGLLGLPGNREHHGKGCVRFGGEEHASARPSVGREDYLEEGDEGEEEVWNPQFLVHHSSTKTPYFGQSHEGSARSSLSPLGREGRFSSREVGRRRSSEAEGLLPSSSQMKSPAEGLKMQRRSETEEDKQNIQSWEGRTQEYVLNQKKNGSALSFCVPKPSDDQDPPFTLSCEIRARQHPSGSPTSSLSIVPPEPPLTGGSFDKRNTKGSVRQSNEDPHLGTMEDYSSQGGKKKFFSSPSHPHKSSSITAKKHPPTLETSEKRNTEEGTETQTIKAPTGISTQDQAQPNALQRFSLPPGVPPLALRQRHPGDWEGARRVQRSRSFGGPSMACGGMKPIAEETELELQKEAYEPRAAQTEKDKENDKSGTGPGSVSSQVTKPLRERVGASLSVPPTATQSQQKAYRRQSAPIALSPEQIEKALQEAASFSPPLRNRSLQANKEKEKETAVAQAPPSASTKTVTAPSKTAKEPSPLQITQTADAKLQKKTKDSTTASAEKPQIPQTSSPTHPSASTRRKASEGTIPLHQQPTESLRRASMPAQLKSHNGDSASPSNPPVSLLGKSAFDSSQAERRKSSSLNTKETSTSSPPGAPLPPKGRPSNLGEIRKDKSRSEQQGLVEKGGSTRKEKEGVKTAQGKKEASAVTEDRKQGWRKSERDTHRDRDLQDLRDELANLRRALSVSFSAPPNIPSSAQKSDADLSPPFPPSVSLSASIEALQRALSEADADRRSLREQLRVESQRTRAAEAATERMRRQSVASETEENRTGTDAKSRGAKERESLEDDESSRLKSEVREWREAAELASAEVDLLRDEASRLLKEREEGERERTKLMLRLSRAETECRLLSLEKAKEREMFRRASEIADAHLAHEASKSERWRLRAGQLSDEASSSKSEKEALLRTVSELALELRALSSPSSSGEKGGMRSRPSSLPPSAPADAQSSGSPSLAASHSTNMNPQNATQQERMPSGSLASSAALHSSRASDTVHLSSTIQQGGDRVHEGHAVSRASQGSDRGDEIRMSIGEGKVEEQNQDPEETSEGWGEDGEWRPRGRQLPLLRGVSLSAVAACSIGSEGCFCSLTVVSTADGRQESETKLIILTVNAGKPERFLRFVPDSDSFRRRDSLSQSGSSLSLSMPLGVPSSNDARGGHGDNDFCGHVSLEDVQKHSSWDGSKGTIAVKRSPSSSSSASEEHSRVLVFSGIDEGFLRALLLLTRDAVEAFRQTPHGEAKTGEGGERSGDGAASASAGGRAALFGERFSLQRRSTQSLHRALKQGFDLRNSSGSEGGSAQSGGVDLSSDR
uniref:Uncharacterized protein n=1 Tax=Chromera velia CCMP2878 TaxID=1169474 RepID=A0A0G4HPK1_9ALVE|eukprot:Cvel_29846.t1-p1 / transcript=Cvel_29846.t1 / gene=Cvel_29846 / organism=Chromera_velia_CCMP2878 / gene_product=hypothetical protein / transcript_product=hypothetical protein / location=Cvel_scaffold4161:4138-9854(-) / protein_length=1634 / sequence_SO=supercontig / SO=protein_coding / is_pseudo=false